MSALEVSTAERDGVLVFELAGELTIETLGTFEQVSSKQPPRGARGLVVDATGLTFMDSSGLGAIVRLHRGETKEVAVAFSGFAGSPKQVLQTTHLDLILNLYDTLEEAETSLREGPKKKRS